MELVLHKNHDQLEDNTKHFFGAYMDRVNEMKAITAAAQKDLEVLDHDSDSSTEDHHR